MPGPVKPRARFRSLLASALELTALLLQWWPAEPWLPDNMTTAARGHDKVVSCLPPPGCFSYNTSYWPKADPTTRTLAPHCASRAANYSSSPGMASGEQVALGAYTHARDPAPTGRAWQSPICDLHPATSA
ncbi:hypothetical protein NDU88_006533 [Pleurodeles waltl]|uniref:Secreted protein n=1 Tax=Pleurodeles waltl TaxID=8319 RepID=A0AAV7QP76_PLEWA|nr:hypothetical protein NDU88_006533 [Pleurodeles waltl]